MMQNLNVRFGIDLSVFQSYIQIFYTSTDFTDQFKRLNSVLKDFEVKDHLESPFLNVKIIDLIRTTLPLYKRLDKKKTVLLINIFFV